MARFLLALLAAATLWGGPKPPLLHSEQVGGEWCLIGLPAAPNHPGEAIVLIHGNGETVGPETSSWEKNPDSLSMIEALRDAGYLIAQSNHTATPESGMWGNAASQDAVLSLIGNLKERYRIERFHAFTVSAGSVVLVNLLLNGKASFAGAAIFSPAPVSREYLPLPGRH